MRPVRADDDQARFRAELRRNGALRWALLRDGVLSDLRQWLEWLGKRPRGA